MKQYVRFDKDMTSIVKGFAILFMLKLHCYNGSNYVVPVNLDHAVWFAHDGFNICVGMFAFLIGYGYAFSKSKDLKYGWQHIKKLMIPYLVIFAVFMLPIYYKEFYAAGWKTMIYTLLGIDVSFYYYNWFIYVFIYAMLAMPLYVRFIDKHPLRNTLIAVGAFFALQVLFHYTLYPHLDKDWFFVIYNCLSLSPLIVLGYLFAHERYYERIRIDQLSKPLVLVGFLLTIALMIVIDSKLRLAGGFLFEFFYAPITIGAIAILFSKFEFKYLRPVMVKLGWASMYMWFLQALVQMPIVRDVYQPVVTIFSDINLIVLWTAVVLFFVAWALRSVVDYLLALPKRRNSVKR